MRRSAGVRWLAPRRRRRACRDRPERRARAGRAVLRSTTAVVACHQRRSVGRAVVQQSSRRPAKPSRHAHRSAHAASGSSRRLRLLIATPSVSRTVGQADDVDAEVEIEGHPPDDRQLLGVLLAEHGDVRPHRGEQLGDDGGHAAEMARSVRALEPIGERAGLDMGLETGRVHRCGGRGVHRVDPGRGARRRGRRRWAADSGRSRRGR